MDVGHRGQIFVILRTKKMVSTWMLAGSQRPDKAGRKSTLTTLNGYLHWLAGPPLDHPDLIFVSLISLIHNIRLGVTKLLLN